MSVFNTFPKEKEIVNRERSMSAYDTLSYYIAKILVEIPLNVLPCIVYSCIIYYMIELRPGGLGLFILIGKRLVCMLRLYVCIYVCVYMGTMYMLMCVCMYIIHAYTSIII